MMASGFSGRVALVIGATGGIGSAVSRGLVARGARVVLFARTAPALEVLASELGDSAVAISGDVRKTEDLQRAVAVAQERFGKLDTLLHCVGTILLKPLQSTSDEEWDETLELNLTSAFRAMKVALPALLKSGEGAVVCISSAAGLTGLRNHEAISAAKAGLVGLVRSAAMTYARRGVRFNAVSAGLVETPLARPITQNEAALNASLALHPMGRIGASQDIAEAVLYLASSRSSWVTGTVLTVDGGLVGGR